MSTNTRCSARSRKTDIDLATFGECLETVVIGAGGGIGGAIADRLDANPRVATVHRFTRTQLDLADPASIATATAKLAGPIDLVIVATGLLHDATHRPEKHPRDLDATWLARSFAVNATGPALVAQALLPRMRTDRKTAFAALSARVGSIADNRLGGWHSYRASKAALNQLVRTLAHDHARRNREGLCVTLHPGTVDTRLSAPFQRGVRELFTPIVAAGHLLDVLDALTPADSGGLFAWDGSRIAY